MHRHLLPLLGAIALGALLSLTGCTSAETRVYRGDEFSQRGEHALALREYQIARRRDPQLFDIDRKIRGAQIGLYLEQGDRAVEGFRWRDAERSYGEVRRLEPEHPALEARFSRLSMARGNWHFDRGQRAMAQGDPDVALQEFEQSLVYHPTHPRAVEALARAEAEVLDRRDRAETAYRHGLRARESGDLAEALRRFEEALLLDADHPGAAIELESTGAALVQDWIDQGTEAAERDDWTTALHFFERALETLPRHPQLATRVRIARNEVEAQEWIASGEDALSREDFARAFTCFERALHLTSTPERIEDRYLQARDAHARVLFSAALRAEQEGRFDEAAGAYRTMLAFHPGHRDAAQRCAKLEQRLDDAEASYAMGRQSSVAGDLVTARHHFSVCLESIANYRDVPSHLEEIDQALELAEGLYGRACLAQREGKARRARILFEEVLGVTRPFRDVDERLSATRSEVFANPGLPSRYEEGCRAQAERDYVRAVRCFEHCELEKPDSEDVATRLIDLRTLVGRAEALYVRASQAEGRCDLESACASFAQCLELCNPFKDARERLDSIQDHRAKLRRAARLEGQLELVAARNLYREVAARYGCHTVANRRLVELGTRLDEVETEFLAMQKAQTSREFRRALGIALGIRARCRTYRDLSARIESLTLEADYADGVAFEAQGDHVRAAKIFQRVAGRSPQFRDARARALENRRKR